MAFWNGTQWVEDAPPTTPRRRERGLFGIATQAIFMTALVLALTAGSVFAAQGGKGGSSSIDLVMVDAGIAALDAAGPNHGDTVTFDVRTTATERPYVLLNCYQSGDWVYAAQAGFWASYPWGQNFILDADSWSSGAANCTARLGVLNRDGTKFRELARTSFDVAE